MNIGHLRRVPATTLSAHFAALVLCLGMLPAPSHLPAQVTTEAFAKEIERVLPVEKPYDYHKRLSAGPVHVPRRDPDAKPQAGELALPEAGLEAGLEPAQLAGSPKRGSGLSGLSGQVDAGPGGVGRPRFAGELAEPEPEHRGRDARAIARMRGDAERPQGLRDRGDAGAADGVRLRRTRARCSGSTTWKPG